MARRIQLKIDVTDSEVRFDSLTTWHRNDSLFCRVEQMKFIEFGDLKYFILKLWQIYL